MLKLLKTGLNQGKRVQKSLLPTIYSLKKLTVALLASDDSMTVQSATAKVLQDKKNKKQN